MEDKRVLKMDFTQHVTCGGCGKKLPVEILNISGSASIAIFCKHCKMVTILDIFNK